MKFTLKCVACGETFSVRGTDEPDTNATVFMEDDPDWNEACEHVRAGGDYEIVDSWAEDDDPF